MDSLTQTQIAKYLRDYNSLIYYMTDNEYEDVSAFEVFEYEVYDEENEDSLDAKSYYKRMLDIAYIYTKMRMFSFAEDYTLKRGNNFINNDDDVVLNLSEVDCQELAYVYLNWKNHGAGYTRCQRCNRLMKQSKTKPKKYCEDCAKEVQTEQKRLWAEKNRKNLTLQND